MTVRAGRRELQPAFVLHTYPYSETSLLVEIFSREYGRVALLARGARRPRSENRGVLRAFQPLVVSFAGSGEVKTLLKAEWQGGMAPPLGSALMSAFYLNELLLRFLPREDAHATLFDFYGTALHELGDATPDRTAQAALLRQFELRLLAELGYAMYLTHEATQHDEVPAASLPINPQKRYHYVFETGACPYEEGAWPDAPVVRGATLLALAGNDYPDVETASEARRLMTQALDHFFEQRPLFSRRIARELSRLRRLKE